MQPILKSNKLANVLYDIRGPVAQRARQMEDEGQRIIKLNIGNLAPFGFDAPEEIQQDMIRNLPNSAGYTDSKGIFAARKAVMHYTQEKNIKGVSLEDIYLGNGVSELIVMAMNALLNTGDEVLIPTPDYPLWTAAVNLSGGTPQHYLCDEANGWLPDLEDIRAKINSRTRAIVIINPNNPTGALYPVDLLKEIVEIARQHDLIIYADEVYDKIVYDGQSLDQRFTTFEMSGRLVVTDAVLGHFLDQQKTAIALEHGSDSDMGFPDHSRLSLRSERPYFTPPQPCPILQGLRTRMTYSVKVGNLHKI